MLRRQQAGAIIAARQKIVEGAVGMVEMALALLSKSQLVQLDEERKAAMVSNLLVVLCADREAQPVVNTGTHLPVAGDAWPSARHSSSGSTRRVLDAPYSGGPTTTCAA